MPEKCKIIIIKINYNAPRRPLSRSNCNFISRKLKIKMHSFLYTLTTYISFHLRKTPVSRSHLRVRTLSPEGIYLRPTKSHAKLRPIKKKKKKSRFRKNAYTYTHTHTHTYMMNRDKREQTGPRASHMCSARARPLPQNDEYRLIIHTCTHVHGLALREKKKAAASRYMHVITRVRAARLLNSQAGNRSLARSS